RARAPGAEAAGGRGAGSRAPFLHRPLARRRRPRPAAGAPTPLPPPAPSAPVGLGPSAGSHAPEVRPGPVRTGGGPGSGGPARPRADRRHHGGVPGGDSRGLRANAGGDPEGPLHGPPRVPLLAPPAHGRRSL